MSAAKPSSPDPVSDSQACQRLLMGHDHLHLAWARRALEAAGADG